MSGSYLDSWLRFLGSWRSHQRGNPRKIDKVLKGGVPGSGQHKMFADTIVEVDAFGKILWEWPSYKYLDFSLYTLSPPSPRNDLTHINSLWPIGDDKIMACLKHLSEIIIIDKKTNQVIWRFGHDQFGHVHDANILPNGNILAFDNGVSRKTTIYPFSRVVEINPETFDFVWIYEDSPVHNFFSLYGSSARRLPNGNTFITEANKGRMFQVTSEQEVVWEYINPYFVHDLQGKFSNKLSRAMHYSKEDVERLLPLPLKK